MNQTKGDGLLYACLNMRKQFGRALAFKRLSLGEYLLLRHVSTSSTAKERGGNVRAISLSAALDMSRPAVSRMLNGLEDKGLIARSIDQSDRRGITITLTQEGAKELETARNAIRNKAEKIAQRLGEKETETLIRLLDRLSEIYRQMADEHSDQE